MTDPRPPLELPTAISGVVLRDIEPSDAPAYMDLVLRNREHLTEFGAETLPPHSIDDVLAWVCNRPERDFQPGIWMNGKLVGHVLISHLAYARGDTEQLLAASPNGFTLGYWIGKEFAGRGYVTEACRALMNYVRSEFGVTDFYSGTFPGNQRSQAVLERLGFEVYKATDEFVSYRLLERVSL